MFKVTQGSRKIENISIPKVPFIFQYIICPPIPCLPPGYNNKGYADEDIVNFLWSTAESIQIRTIRIAAHINSDCNYAEFEKATLMPFDWRFRIGDKDYISVKKVYSLLFKSPNSLYDKSECCEKIGDHNEESQRCLVCNQAWTFTNELLGRIFLLEKLSCDILSTMVRKEEELLTQELLLLQSVIHDYKIW
jgi:hypothetical protein